MVLFINGCPRNESRTKRLADAVLATMEGVEEVDLYRRDLLPVDGARLKERDALLKDGKTDDETFALARQFAFADTIVIAVPFWDLSFPSKLKIYLENVYVTGIVSRYDQNGRPVGLCHAKRLIYVTTSGGPLDVRFGYDYVKTLATDYFGIPEVSLVKAEMLDIVGNDAEAILNEAIREVTAHG